MPVKIITTSEIRRLIEVAAPLQIIDVRTPGEYKRVHATGARLVPLDQIDPAALGADRAAPDQPLYLICQSGKRAAIACQRLSDAGVEPVWCIAGGTAAWERDGLPVQRSSGGVISLERQVRIGAGSLVLLGLILAWLVSPLFLILTGFIGAGLVFAGVTDFCGMAMLLARMPWNRRAEGAARRSP